MQKWIPYTFEEWSSLKINYEKSNIFLRNRHEKYEIERVLGYSRETFPIKYLEVPLRENKT